MAAERSVTWVKRSLFARLTLSLTAVLIASFALAAWASIAALHRDLESRAMDDLRVVADGTFARIERSIAGRADDVHLWSSLEIMEDLPSHDRQFRIQNFLVRLRQEYPSVYSELTAIDADRRVVASTNLARIGQRYDLASLALTDVGVRGTRMSAVFL